jgi:hypothetical protein
VRAPTVLHSGSHKACDKEQSDSPPSGNSKTT